MKFILISVLLLVLPEVIWAAEVLQPRTSLANASVSYSVPEKNYVVLRKGPLEVVVADNRATDDAILPGHRAGYHAALMVH